MRVRKKDQKNLVKVGIFITCLTIVLMIIITSIGKETSLFSPKVTIHARVPNVSNLKAGSYVELRGIRIGAVNNISIISEDRVQIEMSILEEHLKWIKTDSKVSISTAGLVGDKFVEIFNGSKEAPTFRPSKDILLADESTGIQEIITKGDSIASSTDRILSKLDKIMVKLEDGELIVNTLKSMNRTASNLEKITSDLKDAQMGKVAANVNQSMDSLNKATASLQRILSRVENGPGTANSLIYDEGLHDDLRALLGGAQRNKVIKYFIRESIKKSEERKPQKE